MDGVEDESAAPAEDLAPLQDLGPDLLRGAEGQGLLGVDAAAPKTMSRPYFSLRIRASMPAAETWTGLRMSKPLSMKDGMSVSTAPQECLKVFQAVCRWTQPLIRL